MATIHHDSNGSSPHKLYSFPRRIAQRVSAGDAPSPTVGDILSPELRASLRGDGGPSPLWARVLEKAIALSMNEAECTLLQRTRLVDLIGQCACVSVAADDLTVEREWVLRTRLTAALHQVGLSGYRLEFNFTSAPDTVDAE
jgi:hypothetical protein